MEITLTTPALLFPALSLLLLAFTNRFLGLATLIRSLKDRYASYPNQQVYGQIENLRERLLLIRNMQIFGSLSMFGCVLCMFLLFADYTEAGKYVFAFSLIMMLISLALAIREIQISVKALELELNDLQGTAEK
ncbi:DUF2721 domain-containing protein [Pontibacter mangrovi]|uniref:DUF2721 domain-containing protein n=1 Tax=Pontibacter mangrovi TaxID=2589816 RepID=A0A501VZX0_9BACT|nr:DUF2721 domain-containing protein [Pontibacter mangrovi]TPE42588.1 DUF2721 domain-containing protein [Pontibacter mangrovi]